MNPVPVQKAGVAVLTEIEEVEVLVVVMEVVEVADRVAADNEDIKEADAQ